MSRDVYKIDLSKHGAAHIDRYRKKVNVGRYRFDGTPIMHKGVTPPPIPHADRERFEAEVRKASVLGLRGGSREKL
jgi:hypothetical protein